MSPLSAKGLLLLQPIEDVIVTGTAAKADAGLPIAGTGSLGQVLAAVAKRTRHGRAEGNNFLAVKVVAFHEGVDDVRRLLPPQGIADIDRIIGIPIGDVALIGRPQLRLGVFANDAAVVVTIVEIAVRIGLGRLNFKDRRIFVIGNRFCYALGIACRREIDD